MDHGLFKGAVRSAVGSSLERKKKVSVSGQAWLLELEFGRRRRVVRVGDVGYRRG